ncbi:hypothetical protein Syun_011066 [Stephania yunnanensis]|uniref:At1g68980-like TPR repeats domain-containing protein n=1 Tax=Stephania yunnanensis TaxID=152371 RepID=A0AAP0JWU7_9MAGN
MITRLLLKGLPQFPTLIGLGPISFHHHVGIVALSELIRGRLRCRCRCRYRYEQCYNPCLLHFSTAIQPERAFHGGYSSHTILLTKLENALKRRQVDEAWEAFSDFKSLHGFPDKSLISKLIDQLSYSFDSVWLRKAYELVVVMYKEKSDMLHYDFMARLALCLSRGQMPVPASTVLRIMLELRKYPPMDLWRTVFLYMGKTEIGTYLSSDLLVELCECYLHHVEEHGEKNGAHLKLLKPDTLTFNLVLNSCVRFRSTLNGLRIVELMPLVGIVADAWTIVIIAQIYETNGLRDELKKFKEHVDRDSALLLHHYQQFYNCLLSLHFKFDDSEAAAELMFAMYGNKRSGSLIQKKENTLKPSFVTIGSSNLRTGLKLNIQPGLLQKDFVLSEENQSKLVMFIDGKLLPSKKALAKLINGYNKHGNISELTKHLITIRRVSSTSSNTDLSLDVMDACIQLGWLETAHDILDDMEMAGIPMDVDAYHSLLRAYSKQNRPRDAEALVKQIKKFGLLEHLPNDDTKVSTPVRKSALVESLIQEMGDDKATDASVHNINSSIYYFCKGNMIDDAVRTYRRMQERKIQPTVETFAYLVNGYSSLGMYREITILWGDIKRIMDTGDLAQNRDLHEVLLWNFIRGGYFERVMEVLEYMKKYGLYTDKWKYKRHFLKLHKNLYRSLRASEAKTEAQRKRLEHVRQFRKWVGID